MESTPSTLFNQAEHGERDPDALFAALYAELRRLAHREMARHGRDGGFSATTLLHETYLDIAGASGSSFPDPARFMSYAAHVMRGLIIDRVRSRHSQKRGGQFVFTSAVTAVLEQIPDARELTRIGDALDELAEIEPSLAEIVDLRFFCGFTFAEIAAMRRVSERTVQRQWEKARIYLHRDLRRGS